MAKKIEKILSCICVFVILMNVVPVSVFAVDVDNNSTGNSLNRLNGHKSIAMEKGYNPEDIKFKGTLTFQRSILGYNGYYFKVDKVLEGSISTGDEIRVMVYSSSMPELLHNYDYPLEIGDKAEIYAIKYYDAKSYDSWVDNEVWSATITSSAEYYVKKLESEPSLSINVWTDKSEYKIGETVKIYYKTNKKCTAKLTVTKPDGEKIVYGPNEIPACTRSKSATAGYPTGTRTVVFEAWADGESKKATCYFDVADEKKPNLVIESISPDIANAKIGDTIKFTVKTKNKGEGDADAFYIYYYIDGDKKDSYYVSSGLDAGKTKTTYFSWEADKCGKVQMKAKADVTNAVTESEEGDNTKIKTLNVECPEPDSDGDGVPDNVDNCPNDPNPNQIDFDGDGVGNECDTEFQIGMFVYPQDHYITTVKDGGHQLPKDLSFESGDYVELLTKLKDNGIMRIFVNTYEAKTENEDHIFYAKKKGAIDVGLNFKNAYNLNTLLTEAHNLNINIEVHACVACFGPEPGVDPTSGNQKENLKKVVKYLLDNYEDGEGKGLDGIHLDFVRYVPDAKKDTNTDAKKDTNIIASFIDELNEIVENRAKLSASVFAADHEYSETCSVRKKQEWCWAGAYDAIKNDLGQDYTKMSYNPNYVGSVTEFVNNKVENNCNVIPDIQVFCEWHCNKWSGRCGEPSEFCEGDEDCIKYVKHEEPGFEQIKNALNSAKCNGAKGTNIFRYTHLSDAEWYGIRNWEKTMTSASIKCPADLHAYDSQGRHVGVNAKGGIDLEIPNAYYTGPDSEHEQIIIPDLSNNIVFKVEALDTGKFGFTLTSCTGTKTTTITYLDVPITQTTEATVAVSTANPTYTMEIDNNGDGTTDYTKEPDSIEPITEQTDYTKEPDSIETITEQKVEEIGGTPSGEVTGINLWIRYNGAWTKDPAAIDYGEWTYMLLYLDQGQRILMEDTYPSGYVTTKDWGYLSPGYHYYRWIADAVGWHKIVADGSITGQSNEIFVYVWPI